MIIYLDESKCREQLFPFTHTRHVADIRVGILTIREKWKLLVDLEVQDFTGNAGAGDIVVNANIIPSRNTTEYIIQAARDKTPLLETEEIKMLQHPWQIFEYNDWAIRKDFELVSTGRKSTIPSAGIQCTNEKEIFVEESARLEHCYLNASAGPIYIGKNVLVMDGAMIRGPFAAGEGCVIKMGAKIYGATSLGPYCVAGGEIKNTVMFAHSNKAHDGYLGDSVLGEWCNLGAGTSNSTVKNTGGLVKYIIDGSLTAIPAGNKAGLLMGDYSRAAINTSFNTGTIVGVCCNIFGVNPCKFVNNFTWGNERYIFEKALSDISNWKKMKSQDLTTGESTLLENLYKSNL
jgi:UDP-N-acetylglucosamine diphosphorylase/glucosamine-1-phosphate N-acetyltransferase